MSAARSPSDPGEILQARADTLRRLERDPEALASAKVHYREAPWDFLEDWGLTFDPRLLDRGGNPVVPFVPWPRQVEYLQWVQRMWKTQQRGLVEKSRDCGVTWLSVGFAVTHWLFTPGFVARIGSRKEDLVDKSGDMDAIFPKAWFFLTSVPRVFWPRGFGESCRAHLRITNPETGAAITGEAGDNIGRGGRASIAFVDEAAFVEHQELVDAALSQTTNCQIDISTPNGSGNAFYKKRMRWNGTDKVFIFDWRDDPRKGQDWYEKQRAELDEVTVAQEIDRDYNASAEDVFIPAKWVKAAIDAHVKLGFEPEGIRVTGFDPADVGDAKAVVHRHGSVIRLAEEKKDGDIAQAVPWAASLADDARADVFAYDGDGMGAPVIKVAAEQFSAKRYRLVAYHGSGGVEKPGAKKAAKRKTEGERSNADTYLNYRAQTYSWVRERFRKTFEAVERAKQGLLVKADPEDLISIDRGVTCLHELVAELSRPQRQFTRNGKVQVESKADMKKRGVQSPNLADALVIAMSVREIPAPDNAVDTGHAPGVASWESI